MEDTVTIYAKVVAKQAGQYTEYVVEDLNRDYTDDLKYVTVVKLPNWDLPDIEIGDVGYIKFQYVEGGISKYFKKETENWEIYKYTNNYLINFYKEQERCTDTQFKF